MCCFDVTEYCLASTLSYYCGCRRVSLDCGKNEGTDKDIEKVCTAGRPSRSDLHRGLLLVRASNARLGTFRYV